MPRKFTARDARELISYCRELLHKLDRISSLSQKYNRDAALAIERINRNHGLTAYAQECLFSDVTEIEGNAEILALLRALKNADDAGRLAAEANLISSSKGRTIRNAADSLGTGSSILRWTFAGKDSRNKAEKAWSLLSRFAESSEAEHIEEIYDQSQLTNEDDTELLSSFKEDPQVYRDLYDALNIHKSTDQGGIGEVNHLFETINALDHEFTHTEELMESGKKLVREKAAEMVEAETRGILKNVPVDEINREKKGYRLKPLKENGIQTVDDLYVKSVSYISDLQGIGDATAKAMKEDAAQIAEETRKTVRIRLNADERNTYSAALAKALSSYRRKTLDADEIRRLHTEKYARISTAAKHLREISDGTGWLFASKEERTKYLNDYRYLNEICHGEYVQQVYELFSHLENIQAKEEDSWQDFEKNNIQFYNILEDVVPGVLGGDDQYGLPAELAQEIRNQELGLEGLKCELRRYQEWGVKYILHQERVLLGDEMGLGKTIQAIASMVALRNGGCTHFLVVCPASVLPNWCREIAEKSDLVPYKVHGNKRLEMFETWKRNGGAAVTTFETTGFLKMDEDEKFDFMIVDEAHYIKNAEANRTLNVKALAAHADRLLFMTGTALENRVDEMLALLSVLQPEISSEARSIAFMASADRFREKIAPVYYRRKREDVLTELPDLIDNREWVTLSHEENMLYEKDLLTGSYADIRRVSWNVDDLNHSAKAARMMEIIEEAAGEERKIIVFSFFLKTLSDVRNYLGDRCTEPITGSVSPQKRQEIIDAFNKAPAGTVLCAQIQSGGTGLNIQSASVVIFCEPQLKPSIENQAVSRAYRMGQARNVLVYRLLADDTVDERIMDMLSDKQAVFDAFADASSAAAASLDAEVDETTFGNIVKEEIERIEEKRKTEGEQIQ